MPSGGAALWCAGQASCQLQKKAGAAAAHPQRLVHAGAVLDRHHMLRPQHRRQLGVGQQRPRVGLRLQQGAGSGAWGLPAATCPGRRGGGAEKAAGRRAVGGAARAGASRCSRGSRTSMDGIVLGAGMMARWLRPKVGRSAGLPLLGATDGLQVCKPWRRLVPGGSGLARALARLRRSCGVSLDVVLSTGCRGARDALPRHLQAAALVAETMRPSHGEHQPNRDGRRRPGNWVARLQLGAPAAAHRASCRQGTLQSPRWAPAA